MPVFGGGVIHEEDSKSKGPAGAISTVLQFLTKKQNAENELRSKIMIERAKTDDKYAKDLLLKGQEYQNQKKLIGQKQQALAGRRQAEANFKYKREATMEKRYIDLYEKKRSGVDFAPREEAEWNILEHKMNKNAGKGYKRMNFGQDFPTIDMSQRNISEGSEKNEGWFGIGKKEATEPVEVSGEVSMIASTIRSVNDLKTVLRNIGKYERDYGKEQIDWLKNRIKEDILPALSVKDYEAIQKGKYLEELEEYEDKE